MLVLAFGLNLVFTLYSFDGLSLSSLPNKKLILDKALKTGTFVVAIILAMNSILLSAWVFFIVLLAWTCAHLFTFV